MVTRWKTSKLHFLVINLLTNYMRHDSLNTIFFWSKRTPQTFQRNHILTHFQYVNNTLTF
jgi:hypothetical protein